jgi:hypothetical protein
MRGAIKDGKAIKDEIEEQLFARRHDLFSEVGGIPRHHVAGIYRRRRRDAGRAWLFQGDR